MGEQVIKNIINKYRIKQGGDFRPMSFEKFAAALTEAGYPVSAVTIYRWATGDIPIVPDRIKVLLGSSSWVNDFAQDVLSLTEQRNEP